MNVKIVFNENKVVSVDKLTDETSRPLSSYAEGIVVPNTVYSIVTMQNTAVKTKNDLLIKIFDVDETTLKWRGLFLTALIEDSSVTKESRFATDASRWPLVKLGFNLASPTRFSRPSEDPLFEVLFKKVWTRTAPALAKILSSLQTLYVEGTPSCKHHPWLADLSYADIKAFIERIDYKIGARW